MSRIRIFTFLVLLAVATTSGVRAQSGTAQQPPATAGAPATPPGSPAAPPGAAVPQGVQAPAGYLIGTDDVLIVIFWQEKDMSAEVTVRPDGKISLPLLNDIQAAGQTPEQLRASIEETARKFLQEPSVTVVVKQINSRKVFITGMVGKPGPYNLTAPTTVLQLIATAGGLQEYADREHIVIVRNENGRPTSYRFNYKEVVQQKRLSQNIELKAGDTVVVP
ncbi:MAG: polysaccharide biosynthesis/export family protein [Vicinamibacterales bacterium]